MRHTLDELPESLDETYERVLQEIKKPNREHARRLLQCLVVAIRPLRVEELAEVLAVDFGDEGMPKLNPNWRWEDQEQAILSSCSSLIAIVESDGSRVVQFSHFSVKEFLTSPRLSTSNGDISRYHIVSGPAHTTLAQACMSVLLRSEDRVEENGARNRSPLVGYAAEHWVAHAQDEKVRSCLRKAMEYLFDVDKPYFAAWLKLHDMDRYPRDRPSGFTLFAPFSKSGATPLYYAALCGFQDLVEYLIANNREHVNAEGGFLVTPLVAALARRHFQTAKILHDNGANPDVRSSTGRSPLHSAAYYGKFDVVQELLKFKADVNVRDAQGYTPLRYASQGPYSSFTNLKFTALLSNVARLLLKHGADVNAAGYNRWTPLHEAVQLGRVEVVRVLLEHGANVDAEDNDGKTPLQFIPKTRRDEIVKLLSEHRAG